MLFSWCCRGNSARPLPQDIWGQKTRILHLLYALALCTVRADLSSLDCPVLLNFYRSVNVNIFNDGKGVQLAHANADLHHGTVAAAMWRKNIGTMKQSSIFSRLLDMEQLSHVCSWSYCMSVKQHIIFASWFVITQSVCASCSVWTAHMYYILWGFSPIYVALTYHKIATLAESSV